MPSRRQQTSVRLSPAAVAALQAITTARGLSRDATIRALLDEYLTLQAGHDEDNLLTHISTALRYPPPPTRRHESDGRERVAFRLDPGVADRIARFTLRLPGQPARRGPGHYSPRPLSDALAVAIARAHPYVDPGLEDLPQLITHSTAIGLWRLAVAATLTNAEAKVLLTAPESAVATVLSEEDVAWHAPWRFDVARHLAGKLLVGTDRSANLSMLKEQHAGFRELLHSTMREEWPDSPLLADCTARPGVDHEGQGGAAVWRAERKLTEMQIARWLTCPPAEPQLETLQPGWTVTMPRGWYALPFAHGQVMTAAQRAEVDGNRVLEVVEGSRRAIWPYQRDGSPVVRFDLVITAGSKLTPASLIELALLRTDDVGDPWVPADLAADWGMITLEERDALHARARRNRERVAARGIRGHWRDMTKVHAALVKLVDQPENFAHLASQQGVPGGPFQGGHTWQITSLADVLTSPATDDQVRWLVHALDRRRTWQLEQSMRSASREAYWLGRPDADAIV